MTGGGSRGTSPRAVPYDAAVRIGIVCGLGIAACAWFAPAVLVALALAYPVGLAVKAVTGGTIDGQRTRLGLISAAVVGAAAQVGLWLQSRAPMGVSIGWAVATGVGGGALVARLLMRLNSAEPVTQPGGE